MIYIGSGFISQCYMLAEMFLKHTITRSKTLKKVSPPFPDPEPFSSIRLLLSCQQIISAKLGHLPPNKDKDYTLERLNFKGRYLATSMARGQLRYTIRISDGNNGATELLLRRCHRPGDRSKCSIRIAARTPISFGFPTTLTSVSCSG